MYPYEDHGPATRESDLDQWARWIAWFDMYVKNPQKKDEAGGGRSLSASRDGYDSTPAGDFAGGRRASCMAALDDFSRLRPMDADAASHARRGVLGRSAARGDRRVSRTRSSDSTEFDRLLRAGRRRRAVGERSRRVPRAAATRRVQVSRRAAPGEADRSALSRPGARRAGRGGLRRLSPKASLGDAGGALAASGARRASSSVQLRAEWAADASVTMFRCEVGKANVIAFRPLDAGGGAATRTAWGDARQRLRGVTRRAWAA